MTDKTTEALKLALEKAQMLMQPIPDKEVTALEIAKAVSERALELCQILEEALVNPVKQEPVKACVSGVCPNKAKCDAAQFCLYTEAEPVKQEPVAWMWVCVDVESRSIETGLLFDHGVSDENTDWTPLYAAPVSVEAAATRSRSDIVTNVTARSEK